MTPPPGMEFGLLGPLLAAGPDGLIMLRSARQRALLAMLLLHRGEVISPDRLIDELWGEAPPATAAKGLQVHLSQLRRALGAAQPIVTRPNGYAVDVGPAALDLDRFDAHVADARALRERGDPAGASAALRAGLALFRGPPLADVELLGPAAAERTRLEELRTAAHEERIELDVELGAHGAVIGELEALVREHPYRERVHALLMLALYRAGRQADALEAFRRARSVLVEDLGLDPGPELVRLEAAILAHDPSLDRAAAPAPAPVAEPHPAGSPPRSAESAGLAPRPASPLVGREVELEAALVLALDPEVRLLTITGPGGMGKTRLALELAQHLGDRARFVELGSLDDPERVVPAIAEAVGADGHDVASVAAHLRRAPGVLVLDNFEQVLPAARDLAALLAVAPDTSAVVTSRAALRIAGEHELPMPPLHADGAAELFVRRARALDPSFAADGQATEVIRAICARLDGLPLAIELAAARTRVLSPPAILERLGGRLDLLTGGSRDAPERQRTLRAAIAWSHELLGEPERHLFARLAVFTGGWPLDGAEAAGAADALDALSALVDQSLVVRTGERFAMLETVREFAREQLDASGAADDAARRHAAWCLELAERAEASLETPEQTAWLERLDADQENLRAAGSWAIAAGEAETALRLAGAFWHFWLWRGRTAEAGELVAAALAAEGGSDAARAKALNVSGVLAGAAGDHALAERSFAQSLVLARRMGDRPGAARAISNLGVLAVFARDFEGARGRYEEALGIWEDLGDVRGRSVVKQNLAVVHDGLGEPEAARALVEESVELAREAGDPVHVASTVHTLGRLLAHRFPEDARAVPLLREGLELSRSLGENVSTIEGLEAIAGIAVRDGDAVTAATLMGAAQAQRDAAGSVRQPDESDYVDDVVAAIEAALDPDAHAVALARGRWMAPEAAVDLALTVV